MSGQLCLSLRYSFIGGYKVYFSRARMKSTTDNSEDICLQTLTSFRSRAQNYWCVWLAEGLSSWSNPLLTDEFPTRFSTGVDTRISFKL